MTREASSKKIQNQKKRPAKKRVFLRGTLGLGILCVVICLIMIGQGVAVQPDINENKNLIAELNSQIEQEKERQAEVDHMRENSSSDEYIEKVARDRLGMIKNDEIVFVDVSEN